MAGQPIIPTGSGGNDILLASKGLVTVPAPTDPASAVTKTYADGVGTSTLAAANAYTDKYGIGAAIPTATDLNIYNTTGKWYQVGNAAAAAGTNYPAPYAGVLEVTANGGTIMQRYTTYGTTGRPGTIYLRNFTSSAWTAWMQSGDTPNVASGIISAATGWSITTQTGSQRSGIAFIHITATRTGAAITVPANGDITNSAIGTLFGVWVPSYAISYSLSGGGTGPLTLAVIHTASVIQLTAIAPGATIATGTVVSFGGAYPVG